MFQKEKTRAENIGIGREYLSGNCEKTDIGLRSGSGVRGGEAQSPHHTGPSLPRKDLDLCLS